jgi:hypothetical protein
MQDRAVVILARGNLKMKQEASKLLYIEYPEEASSCILA